MKTDYIQQSFTAVGVFLFALYFWNCVLYPVHWHYIDTVNLIFHEAGHALSIFSPAVITALMGSVFQVLVPLLLVIYFLTRREVLSAYLLILWVCQSLSNVTIYIRDAIPMNLNLLGGDSVIHDWNFILNEFGILKHSVLLADMISMPTYIVMLITSVLLANACLQKFIVTK